MNKKIFVLIMVYCLIALNVCSAEKSNKAVDFALRDLNDKVVRLSQFKGKLIILDFWATWCGWCLKEIPSFIELQNEYKDEGVLIIGISCDDPGAINKVRKFVKQYNINYQILMVTDKVIKDYGGIRGLPTTFIIDEKGEIEEKYVGYREKSVFESHIKKYLERKKESRNQGVKESSGRRDK